MTATPPLEGGELDGRRLRREQNRDTVLDAMVELFREGVLQPSSGEIAERAGLSPRSLFRYFEDVDDLHRAAIERQLARARALLDHRSSPDEPTATKIDAIVAARTRLFDATAPAARSARSCAHRHPVIAAQVREARRYLHHQLRVLFAPELEGRAGVLPAVDALCAFEAYELMRFDQGLSRAAAAEALTTALTALLGDSQ
jgi:AcrR family transcriptional regulator